MATSEIRIFLFPFALLIVGLVVLYPVLNLPSLSEVFGSHESGEGGSQSIIDLTDVGRLHGEIALGYYRIRRMIEDIEGFPVELAQAVGHIILSHHGTLEHGSPVVPCTREATLVHMVDNLGGRLGSFDRLEKELAPGSRWSQFDRAIGAGAFFAGRRLAGGESDRSESAARAAEAPATVREAA